MHCKHIAVTLTFVRKLIFLLFVFASPLFAELHGKALIKDIENFFRANGYPAEENKIVQKTANDFPANVIVSFPNKNAPHSLILNFAAEDAYKEKANILLLLKTARNAKKNYSLVFLFSYGDEDGANISGSDAFAKNIDNPENLSCLAVSFTGKKRALIIPGGANKVSPRTLLKTSAECLEKNKILYEVRAGFAASLFRLGILQTEKRASSFLKNGISSISLAFPHGADFVSALSYFLLHYRANEKESGDTHYVFLQNGLHFFLLGERFIIVAFIIMSFINLFAFITRSGPEKKTPFKNDILFYLFAVSTLNIFIFSAIDISLFFLFAFEFIIVYLSRFAAKPFGIFFSLAVMTVPFVPFAKEILVFGSEKLFSTFTPSSFASLLVLFFALLPFFLQIIRIFFLLLKNKKTKTKIIAIFSFAVFGSAVFAGVFFVFGKFSFLTKKNTHAAELKNDDLLSCTVEDEVFFGTTLRKLSVDLGENARTCTVSVRGISGEAVLYSEDEYFVNDEGNTATFAVPSFPPRTLRFSYTANTAVRSVISVSASYEKNGDHRIERRYAIVKDAHQNRRMP